MTKGVPEPQSGLIPLTQLARELWSLTGQEPPNYRQLHMLVLDGTIPAELVRGRWQIEPTDLPGIAQTLGLAPTPRVRGSRRWSLHAGSRRKTSPAAA
jgi:hypothetical protein